MSRQRTLELLEEIRVRSRRMGEKTPVRVIITPGQGSELWEAILEEAFQQDLQHLPFLAGHPLVLVPQTTQVTQALAQAVYAPIWASAGGGDELERTYPRLDIHEFLSRLDQQWAGGTRPLAPFVCPLPDDYLNDLLDARTSPPNPVPLLIVLGVEAQDPNVVQVSCYPAGEFAPPEQLDFLDAPVLLRNLPAALNPNWRDNFLAEAARTTAELDVDREIYEFSLQHLGDPRYRNLLIQEAWGDSQAKCLEMLRRHRVLFLTGRSTGVDFFARLLLRRLAEEPDSLLRRGLQFAGYEAFGAYRPENVRGAGFVLRHFLDHFLLRGRPEEGQAFSTFLRGPALRECLHRLEENHSYLIFTCSQGYNLKQFEKEARQGNGEASLDELRGLWAGVHPQVPLADVFYILPNRGRFIARALNTYWGSHCAPERTPFTHVSSHVRPRFAQRIPKS